MAYIGVQPRLGNFQACDAITASATTTFNLLVGGTAIFPQSAQHCLVSLNGVLQAPISSYTISGSTIIFAAALTTDDSIDFITILGDTLDLGVPSDDTVGAAQIKADLISGTTALAAEPADTDEFLVSDAGVLKRIDYSLIKGGGITVADQWRISASATDVGEDVLTANWETVDTYGLGSLGSNMTQSSGVFTFPSTGFYYVTFQAKFAQGSGDQRYCHVYIDTSTDSGSNWNRAAEGSAWFTSAGDSGTKYSTAATNILLDVSNTSTVKVRFKRNTEASIVTEGDSTNNLTFATFIRLGDT